MTEPFETIAQQWKDFDQWKTTTKAFAARFHNDHQEMLASRKRLVEETREFKRLADEEKLTTLKGLLKIYQSEIDSSNQRFKDAEAGLTRVLHPLLSISSPQPHPDPNELRKENDLLKRSLEEATRQSAEARQELVQLKTIHENQKELWMELEDLRQERDQLECDLAASEEREQKCLDRINNLDRQHAHTNHLLDQALDRVSQLSHSQNQQAEAKSTELEILLLNLDQARSQLIALQRENEMLLVETNTLKTQLEGTQKSDELRNMALDFYNKESELVARIDSLSSKIAAVERENSELHAKIAAMGDYEQIKREANLLKSDFFADEKASSLTLEQLLTQKNKHLETKVVHFRCAADKLSKDLSVSKDIQADLERKISELEETVQKLESSTNSAVDSGKEGLITILTNQRDRFKKRNQDLEAELQRIGDQFERQKGENARLSGENLKLFEKAKYLESYAFKKNSPKDCGTADAMELGQVLPTYEKMYEEQIDPFRLFVKSEFVRKFRELGQADRTVWRIGKVFFTNRMLRKLVTVYFVLIHVLLLVWIFHTTKATKASTVTPI